MYAHVVLEDLQKELIELEKHGSPKTLQYKAAHELAIRLIRASHKFHVGEIHELEQAFRRERAGDNLFEGRMGTDVRLRYKSSWFDFHVRQENESGQLEGEGRCGCLAQEITDTVMEVLVVVYYANEKKWGLIPFHHLISVGIPFSESLESLKVRFADSPGLIKPLENGMQRGNLGGHIKAIPFLPELMSEEEMKVLTNSYAYVFAALNFTLMALNAMNIKTQAHHPDKRMVKARQKRGKPEPVTYYTLLLRPISPQEQSIPKHLWEQKLHWRSGSFRYYTADKPLFGRVVGRIWVQEYHAGNVMKGTIMKDYDIDARAFNQEYNKPDKGHE